MSATAVNQDHYINGMFHRPGRHDLTTKQFDTSYVLLTVRILVDASDPQDIQNANALQDQLRIESASDEPYEQLNYDSESLQSTTKSLIKLAAGLPDVKNTFGKKHQVDKVRHLLATAYGWGGLPESEVMYINVEPDLPVGAYSLSVTDVPVDGFWSISVYNKDGFFEENEYDSYSVNNLTAVKNKDGTYRIHFGGDSSKENFLPITEGWNYVVRLYRPRANILDGNWKFPTIGN